MKQYLDALMEMPADKFLDHVKHLIDYVMLRSVFLAMVLIGYYFMVKTFHKWWSKWWSGD